MRDKARDPVETIKIISHSVNCDAFSISFCSASFVLRADKNSVQSASSYLKEMRSLERNSL